MVGLIGVGVSGEAGIAPGAGLEAEDELGVGAVAEVLDGLGFDFGQGDADVDVAEDGEGDAEDDDVGGDGAFARVRAVEVERVGAAGLLGDGGEDVFELEFVLDGGGEAVDDLLVAAEDFEALIAYAVDLEAVGGVGADDGPDEIDAGLVLEVEAEFVDVGGFEDVGKPGGVDIFAEVLGEIGVIEFDVEAGVGVEGDVVAGVVEVVFDDGGEGEEGLDDFVFGSEAAIGVVGDLEVGFRGGEGSVDEVEVEEGSEESMSWWSESMNSPPSSVVMLAATVPMSVWMRPPAWAEPSLRVTLKPAWARR